MTRLMWPAIFALAFLSGTADAQECASLTGLQLSFVSEANIREGFEIGAMTPENKFRGVSAVSPESGPCLGDFLRVTDSGTVAIQTAFDIDEKIPQADLRTDLSCRYRLTCTNSQPILVDVILQDENDDVPIFTGSALSSITVSEVTAIGTEVHSFANEVLGASQVRDRDSADKPNKDKLQLIILSSTPELDAFDVNERLGLKVQKRLDYEDPGRRTYTLVLTLRDTYPRLGSNFTFTVNIADEDDQPPVFESTIYALTLRAPDVRVDQCYRAEPIISAKDGDLTINAEVAYALESANDRLFAMNCAEPGSIRVTRPLSSADGAVIDIDIKATQTDVTDRIGRSHLRIIVRQPPTMSKNIYTAEIAENSAAGSIALSFSTWDTPELPTSNTTFTLNDTSLFKVVQVGTHSAALVVKDNAELDYEKQVLAVLSVRAEADGMPSAWSSVAISLTDANDNAPQFAIDDAHTLEVNEAEPGDEKWRLTVEASDKDSGNNGKIKFRFDGACAFFELGQTVENGQGRASVTVNADKTLRGDNTSAQRDSDGRALYTCDIVAEDLGTPSLSSRKKVAVYVFDVNDHAPVFTENGNGAVVNVVLGAPAGTLVACLSATDSDQPGTGNSMITYALSESDDFTIDSTNGQIRTKRLIQGGPRVVVLSVTAKDAGLPQRQNTSNISVNILTASGAYLEFDSPIYSVSVAETDNTGDVVLTVEAKMDGQRSNTIRYTMNDASVPFAVNEITGQIQVTSIIDREKMASWSFMVKAEDSRAFNRTAYAHVTVDIIDVNDNAPRFVEPDGVLAQILEGSPQGALVACLSATDADEPGENNSKIEYTISGSDSNLFTIDVNTGKVTLAKRITEVRRLNAVVRASDRGTPIQSSAVTLTVDVVEEVLRVFAFENLSYKSSVPEDSAIGRRILVVAATVNGTTSTMTRYSIAGDAVPFDVNAATGEVTLSALVDRERNSSWTFQVAAVDSSVPGRTAYALVTVDILDVNDNAPRFKDPSNSEVLAQILEGSPEGTLVACFYATDDDEPGNVNSEVQYVISGSDGNLFSIDVNTGKVTLARRIADVRRLNAVVTASNRGTPIQSSAATLTVDVVEEVVRVFAFDSLSYKSSILENSALGSRIVSVAATVNGTTSTMTRYSIPDEAVPFAVNATTGEVTLSTLVDREINRSWTFQVAAVDSSVRGRTAYALVTVDILDVNDNAPHFKDPANSKVIAQVLEGSPEGTVVACFYATDDDEPGNFNSEVQYAISGSDSDLFSIDVKTGKIILARRIAEVRRLNAVVTASDRGTPSLSSNATLFVDVVEEVLRVFAFENLSYKSSVPEDSAIGRRILVVAATVNGTTSTMTRYSIAGDAVPFDVNAATGEVTLSALVDRERNSSWTFQLAAVDSSVRGRTAYAQVTVDILDVNDEAPRFKDPANSEVLTQVLEGSPEGTLVACFYATDDDEPGNVNSEVQYAISGSDSDLFSIDKKTGKVTLARRITEVRRLDAVVAASDRGTPIRSSNVTLTVDVAAEVVRVFAFENLSYKSKILEDSSLGSRILLVTATVNGTASAMTRYSIPGEAVPFAVNATTGEVTLSSLVDRERNRSWTFQVAAVDSSVPGRTAYALVTVDILDVNDNAPRFNDPSNSEVLTQILEGSPEGTLVACLYAIDDDEPGNVNSEVQYAISGSDSDLFSIDTKTGKVTLARRIAEVRRLDAVVIASDRGTPSQRSNATLTVDVIGEVERVLAFENLSYRSSILENSALGTTIVIVIAKVNGTTSTMTRYSIPDEAVPFAINATTGEVKISALVDREMNSSWIFQVAAVDSSVRGRTAFALVTVHVLDVNDKAPVIRGSRNQAGQLEATIFESATVGTLVTCIFANDEDEPGSNNTLITYELTPSNSLSIDSNTGTVRLASPVQSGTANISVEVVAVDHGQPSLRSEATTLWVTVIKGVDVSIEFVNDAYTAEVLEAALKGLPIVTVAAVVNGSTSATTRYFIPSSSVPFGVDEASGLVTLNNASLDRETKDTWTFHVGAADSSVPRRTAYTLVTVRVLDVNDNPPVIGGSRNQAGQLEATIFESASVGTLVTCIYATDADESGTNNTLITYKLTPSDQLSIDAQTGEVRLASPIQSGTANISAEVVAMDHGSTSLSSEPTTLWITVIKNVGVEVEFVKDAYKAYATEDSQQGASIVTVAATVNGNTSATTKYFIPSPLVPFSVNEASGLVTLRNATLDRETKDTWTFHVGATDSSVPSRTAYTLVTVHVLDVNDNAPIIIGSRNQAGQLEARIFKSAAAGTLVTCIYATDDDEPGTNNTRITYEISPENELSIDSDTGEVRLASPVQSETSTISVNVIASDRGTPMLRSNVTTLLVTVIKDIEVEIEFKNATYASEVAEDAGIGASIVTVAAAVNGSTSANVRYFIPSSSVPFSVDAQTGRVTLRNATLDRETKDSWTFHVGASDSSLPGRTAYTLVAVRVLDVNDNPPVIGGSKNQNGQLEATIFESASVGTLVTCIYATDADEPGTNNTLITYKLTPSERLSIDAQTGEVRLASPIQSGTASISAEVIAMDHGSTSLSSKPTTLFVTVIKSVDVEIEFVNSTYTAQVKEDSERGASIVTVAATVNGSKSASTKYFIPSSSVPYSVDEVSGLVTLRNATLDREKKDMWTFHVGATDSSVPSRTAYTLVTVHVLDVNDNAPKIIGSRNQAGQLEARVFERASVGTLVTCIYARDDDEPGTSNALITYELSPGNQLSIDADTGEVRLASPIQNGISIISAEVVASDSGENRLSSNKTTILVTVIKDTEVEIEFKNATYTAQIPEDSNAGVSIVNVAATVNGSTSATVRYFIPSSSVPFSVNPETGRVTLRNATLDRETKDTWTFHVGASDSSVPGKTAYTLVTVHVSDVNDNAPVIKGSINQYGQLEAHVYDSSAVGTLVTCIYASDEDEPGTNNSVVRYFITRNDYLSIDSDSGQVSLASPIRDGTERIVVDVTATDMGQPALKSNRSLLVTVVKDVAAGVQFADLIYSASIPEDSQNGTTVINVTATVNGEMSATVTYSLLSSTWMPFSIDETSGAVRVNGDLDRESKASWTFNVIAFDDAVKFKRAYAVVTVNVSDVNDNAPTFRGSAKTPAEFQASIWDNAPIGTLVICIYADDADEPGTKNSLVRYSLSGTNKLSIDDKTGHVTVAESFRGAFGGINATVTATDDGDTKQQTSATLTVTVEKTDTLQIAFTEEEYKANVTDDKNSGDKVLDVTANVNFTRSDTTRYSIKGESVPFKVNETTGVISLKDKVSGDDGQWWTFQVTAEDSKANGNAAYALVRVQLLLATPAFSKSHYVVTLPEDAFVPANITRVEAKATGQRRIVYKIVSGDQGFFRMNKETGELICIKELDRETNHTFSLEIGATYYSGDESGPYSVATLEVRVQDVNDNPPKFSSVSQTFSVMGNATKGAFIGTVKATDADECVNIEYEISNKDFTIFAIDSKTGIITLNEDRFSPSSTFEVKAVDLCENGRNLLAGSLQVKVELIHPVTRPVAMNCFEWKNTDLKLMRQDELSKAVGSNVTIYGFEPTTDSTAACLQAMVYAVSADKGTLMPDGDLAKILGERKSDIEKRIGSPARPVTATVTGGDLTPVYALAAVAAVLFVTSIGLAINVYRRRRFAARSAPPRSEYTNGRAAGHGNTSGAANKETRRAEDNSRLELNNLPRPSGPATDVAIVIHPAEEDLRDYTIVGGAPGQNASLRSTPLSFLATESNSNTAAYAAAPPATTSVPAVSALESSPTGQPQSPQRPSSEVDRALPSSNEEHTQVPEAERRRPSGRPEPGTTSQGEPQQQRPPTSGEQASIEPQASGLIQALVAEGQADMLSEQAESSAELPGLGGDEASTSL